MTDRLWYFAVGSDRQGPVSDEQLRDKIASGEIKADTLVWNSGMVEWAKAADVPGLIAQASLFGRGTTGIGCGLFAKRAKGHTRGRMKVFLGQVRFGLAIPSR